MSASERDPLDILVNGEHAKPEDLELLDTLAGDLLRPQPGLLVRELGFLADDGSIVMITSHRDEEEELPGTSVALALGNFSDDSVKFQVIFGYDNDLVHLTFESEDDLELSEEIADHVLESGACIDERSRKLVEQLKKIVLFSSGKLVADNLSQLPDGGTHLAEVARALIEEHSRYTVRHSEYSLPLPDNLGAIAINGHTVEGNPEDQIVSETLPQIQIVFEDRAAGYEYFYAKYPSGERGLTTYPLKDEVECQEDPDQEEAIEEMLEEAGLGEPSAHDVQLLIAQLVTAATLEIESDE